MRRHPTIDRRRYYDGVRTIPYDLVKELAIALGAVLVIVVALSAVLSSPDVPSATIRSWATADPLDFVTTAANELAGQSTVAQYGPPYNDQSGSVQGLGPIVPQQWLGVHVTVDPPNDFVLQPLSQATVGDDQLATALTSYRAASSDQQQKWLSAYIDALGNASISAGQVVTAPGSYGPVPVLMDRMLRLGRSGGLDALLLTSDHFYQTDYSKALLFMDDGGYLSGLATDQKLTGSQWGMMNETGRYPGQAWLWLYTFWYQIPPYSTASNADLLVVLTMAVLSLALLLVPFIPGLRDLPRWVPIHRLMWRSHYQEMRRRQAAGSSGSPAATPSQVPSARRA
ncbi:MAG TPA: hypothetical protein VEK76_07830 [Candidatus Binatia bacterium]|nr:hypothetical protein [Candidatus Binatia bacterium]